MGGRSLWGLWQCHCEGRRDCWHASVQKLHTEAEALPWQALKKLAAKKKAAAAKKSASSAAATAAAEAKKRASKKGKKDKSTFNQARSPSPMPSAGAPALTSSERLPSQILR